MVTTTLWPRIDFGFPRWVDSYDFLTAKDFSAIYDALEAIEGELGLLPSGKAGTVRGRLFGQGALRDGLDKWARLYWRNTPVFAKAMEDMGVSFGTSNVGVGAKVDAFEVEDAPAIFAMWQPYESDLSLSSWAGYPFKVYLTRVRPEKFWVGSKEVSSAPSSRVAPIGYIAWALPVQTMEA